MRGLAAAVCTLFLVSGFANAQISDLRSGPCTVSGLIISPYSRFDSDFEVRLVNESNVVVATLRTYTQESFSFKGLPCGVYYIETEIGGFAEVRERVDVSGFEREARVPITLESQAPRAFGKAPDIMNEQDIVDVADLQRSPQVMKKFQEATKKLQSGDIEGARIRLESLVTSAPDFYDAHKSLGAAYQRSRRYEDAEKEYQLAGHLRPKSAAPLLQLGSLYLEQIDSGIESKIPEHDVLEKARVVLLRAIEISPGLAFARYLLGVAYYKLGHYSDAETSLLRALQMEPKIADTRLALANVYIRVQDWADALDQLDTYLKDNPRAPNRERVVETRARVERVAHQNGKSTKQESRVP